MATVFDALSHPIRREVLELLKQGSKSAGELADNFPVSKPTMSGHFAKLRDAGLVLSENRGGQVIYSLNMSTLEEALHGFMGRMGMMSDTAPIRPVGQEKPE
ncbi:metalloregulator ArsR/SmtB family transcription factor [Aurantiacibacter gangjinensis]|uniref:ArsR family transcriptional regulator n=1 Tax=Aurantiacibacter gangjinensis TaxID=502682 RepID=A0A0G9MS86_9SPHN|nr:metalloregulator ArsR/SmtB family transcription factor [Aurantiacibacter gangjinensis]APE26969.1 Transcriptional regulator, ArsR family [Aurantiacibacter gangjinensis]KLE33419.1 ArsR family transcriptional regulator [Aurantiacibacter gangjinensis]